MADMSGPEKTQDLKRNEGDSVFKSSIVRQDLSFDKRLASAARIEIDGKSAPEIGGIALFSKIGEGGMGAVYYGFHPRLDLGVAVKLIPFHESERDSERIQRFFREARLCARIKSNHLVRVFDINTGPELLYLVMEYVDGTSAGGLLREKQAAGQQKWLSELDALDICCGAAEGLAAVHSGGVVHRDIKPDNILIPRNKDGSLNFAGTKLADLGLARCEEVDKELTLAGVVFGTPGYMAPEQSIASAKATAASDVFALGATLYALLSGHAPFQGESIIEVLLATQRKTSVPIRQVRPEISELTAAFIERSLQKDPLKRYMNGSIALAALQRCKIEMEKRAAANKALPGGIEFNARRNRFLKSMLVTAVLALVAGGVFVYLREVPAESIAPAVVPSQAAPPHPVPATPIQARLSQDDTSLDLGNGVRLELVRVSAGAFDMGETRAAESGTRHKQAMPAYFIGKYPVTVAQFQEFVSQTKYRTQAEQNDSGETYIDGKWIPKLGIRWDQPGFHQAPTHPAVLITWYDAAEFAKWATARTGRRIALPTEAEWEYAARGPQGNLYPWGDAWDELKANHADKLTRFAWSTAADDGYAFTSPVGAYNNASWCGAVDMAGNAWQWCEDWAGGTKNRLKILKGGSWFNPPEILSSNNRIKSFPASPRTNYGFRVAAHPFKEN